MSSPRKISLKSGKTLEYINGRWYYNGKPRSTKNFTLIDSNGYRKSLVEDGSLSVQDVDENGNPIKSQYIGGTKEEARDKYWEQAPIMRHAVDSIAGIYGINPTVLRNRLNREGFVDNSIKRQNKRLQTQGSSRDQSNYRKLNKPLASLHTGTNEFGLDDVMTYIEQGNVVPTPETSYWDTNFTNEHNRVTHAVSGETNADNISLMGATLKYFRDKAAEDFPNASRITLDEAAGIYYNRGAAGGKAYLKKKYNK